MFTIIICHIFICFLFEREWYAESNTVLPLVFTTFPSHSPETRVSRSRHPPLILARPGSHARDIPLSLKRETALIGDACPARSYHRRAYSRKVMSTMPHVPNVYALSVAKSFRLTGSALTSCTVSFELLYSQTADEPVSTPKK